MCGVGDVLKVSRQVLSRTDACGFPDSCQNNTKAMWVFPKIGVPQNGWFIRENLIKMDDLGVPLFLETPMSEHIMGSCHDNVAVGKSSLIDATSLKTTKDDENTSNCDKMDAWGSFFPSPEFMEISHQCSMFKDSSDEARHVTWSYIVYV